MRATSTARSSTTTATPPATTARPFTTKKEFYAQFRKKSIAHELWLRFLKNKTAVIGSSSSASSWPSRSPLHGSRTTRPW